MAGINRKVANKLKEEKCINFKLDKKPRTTKIIQCQK